MEYTPQRTFYSLFFLKQQYAFLYTQHDYLQSQFFENPKKFERHSKNLILVWSMDRISRNVGDIARIIALLESGKIQCIRTPSQEFRNDPFHKFMLLQAVANAKLENDQKGVNVLRGLKRKIKDGHWIGQARLGYVNYGGQKGKKWLEKDTERWDILKKCWQHFATGTYSVPDIKKIADQLGLKAKPTKKTPQDSYVCLNTFYYMFNDVFYLEKMQIGKRKNPKILQDIKQMILSGEIEGEVHDTYIIVNGKHPQMISEELFNKVQEVLRERGLTHYAKPKTKEFTFSGFIQCGKCGYAVVCEDKIKYKCNNCTKWFTASNTTNLPSHCPTCKQILSRRTLETIRHHTYAHCSGKNKAKKACIQTHYHTEVKGNHLLSWENWNGKWQNYYLNFH